MAGNCNVACAEGHLSLAKERVRVDPKTLLLVPIRQLDSLPLIPMDRREAQAPASVRPYAAEDPELATPNILWLAGIKSPSNCVFFACHPYTPAVLTSSGPRFGLPCI
jgi:hypothetical protein